MSSPAELLSQAETAKPAQAEALYKQILTNTTNIASTSDEASSQSLREQETALVKLGELYRDQKNAQGLAEVITSSRSFMSSTAKAKTAKLIRTLLGFFTPIPDSRPIQIATLTDNIAWAKREKRIFLKHSLETRLASLHLEAQQYKPALALIDSLLTELRRLDDKMILTEVHLLESRVYRGIGNFAKAKAALTSARTAANSIYCPPSLQSALDLQSGVLHAEDKDYTTAYSYFYEAFENMSSQGEDAALGALKYMLLCKVMLNLPEDVTSLLTIKLAVKYAQLREVESMRAIALAHQARNLADFEKVLKEYKVELSSDPTIRSHLAALYDTLLEQNLLRIVEPYSVVEVAYVAETVGQGRQGVEAKLSQMILDKVLSGVLDQGRGCLILFDQPEADNTYGAAIDTLAHVGKVVESLYAKWTVMSSAHYQGPASLPSDYALLSRLTAAHADHDDEANDFDDLRPTSPRPKNPIPMSASSPSENTPLLNPPVPRIEEPSDHTIPDDGQVMRIFWEELRILTRYALPVFGTHILEFSLIMASVVSIGHLSTTALAAISLGSMTANVTAFSIIQGFASALDTMLPSAWTSSQPQLVGLWTQRMGTHSLLSHSTDPHVASLPIAVVMAFLLFPMYLIWFNAESILLSLKQEPEVARLAAIYLRWVSMGLPGLFAVPTQIILIVAPTNVVLNYLLVWGPPSIRLGFIGAPIATAISFNLVSLLSLIYGILYVPRTAWYPLSRRMFTSLGVLVHLGLAGVGQTASEWWAWELVALAASLLGPTALATQSILLSSASTTFQAPFALSVATSVRIGNLLGEGKAQRAGIASNTSIIMALALSAASSAMFLIFRNTWAYLFNNDPLVVSLVASILPIVALFQVFDGNAAVTAGILRARGKQVTGALLNLSSYYIIGIPFGMWLAFRWGMEIYGLWVGLTVSLVYCSFFGTLLCVRTDWDREVWKVMQRLKDQQDKGLGHEHIGTDIIYTPKIKHKKWSGRVGIRFCLDGFAGVTTELVSTGINSVDDSEPSTSSKSDDAGVLTSTTGVDDRSKDDRGDLDANTDAEADDGGDSADIIDWETSERSTDARFWFFENL
ncbi:hypothetical protein H0H92_010384 [Tricholoma furcatifolium]|nr:hypothetical protein H0H92_010384 [Tricholoma furcatifolium]